jgi:ComF family protein
MWMIKKIITDLSSLLYSFLFPAYCYLCKKEGVSLCESCTKTLPRAVDTPFPYITSIYSFKDRRIKKMIHAIKYFHRKDLIAPLVRTIAEELREQTYGEPIIIPIPMPRLRKYIRGHNHTEAIAKEISLQTSIPTENTILLTKNVSKKRQVLTRSRKERLHNKEGAFLIRKNIAGKTIILIDDVTTTGSTLFEARKVALKGGASLVVAYTIAH